MVFGDKDNPLRCSKLAALAKCSARVYMLLQMASTDDDEEGGPAAQTGSLTHAGVAAFHQAQGELKARKDAAWKAIALTAGKFPQAEEQEVRLFITPYMDDPRNINATFWQINGKPAVELKVEFNLPPHELDPTGEDIYVEGTADQVRVENGIPRVDDLKTGKKTGWEMVHDYATQIAAYTFGMRQKYKIPNLQPGRIIRNYGYRVRGATSLTKSPDGVFWAVPFKWDDVECILETVRFQVAMMRTGHYFFNPGPHCTYCEFGGLATCQEHHRKFLRDLS